MSDDADWGPWVDHDGRGCPVVGRVWIAVQAQAQDFPTISDEDWADRYAAEAWDASSWGKRDTDGVMWGVIIRYRVRRPKALRDLIALVETLPAPAHQPERMPEEVAP